MRTRCVDERACRTIVGRVPIKGMELTALRANSSFPCRWADQRKGTLGLRCPFPGGPARGGAIRPADNTCGNGIATFCAGVSFRRPAK